MHLAVFPRGRQARFAARLGHGMELFRGDVLQLLHGAGRLLDAHEVHIRRVAEAEVDVQTVLTHEAVVAGDFAHLPNGNSLDVRQANQIKKTALRQAFD